jgi:hypothetical protein
LEKITKTEKSHRIVSNPTETQNLNLVITTAELRWYTIKDRHDRNKRLSIGIRLKHILVLTSDCRRQGPLCLPKENEDIYIYTLTHRHTHTHTHTHTFTRTNMGVCLQGRGCSSAPRKNLTHQYLQCLVFLTLISEVQIMLNSTSWDSRLALRHLRPAYCCKRQ